VAGVDLGPYRLSRCLVFYEQLAKDISI